MMGPILVFSFRFFVKIETHTKKKPAMTLMSAGFWDQRVKDQASFRKAEGLGEILRDFGSWFLVPGSWFFDFLTTARRPELT